MCVFCLFFACVNVDCTCRYTGCTGADTRRTLSANSSRVFTARLVIGQQHCRPRRSTICVSINVVVKSKHKVNGVEQFATSLHCYWNSHAIWDHMELPATRHR